MTTTTYQNTKVVEDAKDWRVTDKKITAAPAAKDQALTEHRHSEQKLRAAVDELAEKVGQP
ncbi:hypothetical protein [Duganella sp. BJB476]|uniref:hypothetical protein n=1 Tax=Duganella sp. BJB476 TaxID=1871176 RepID=UPI000E356ED0|nr:hypothetical protein [Duganella sp. BJB476]RFP32442.1 hypothetical protein D0T21_09585 [Duganella sp. BJB476]